MVWQVLYHKTVCQTDNHIVYLLFLDAAMKQDFIDVAQQIDIFKDDQGTVDKLCDYLFDKVCFLGLSSIISDIGVAWTCIQ